MTKEDRTRSCLKKVIGPPPTDLTPTATLADDLEMDDLDVVELVVRVEEEFSVKVTEEQGDKLKTWGDVLKLVNKLTAEQQRTIATVPATTASTVATL